MLKMRVQFYRKSVKTERERKRKRERKGRDEKDKQRLIKSEMK